MKKNMIIKLISTFFFIVLRISVVQIIQIVSDYHKADNANQQILIYKPNFQAVSKPDVNNTLSNSIKDTEEPSTTQNTLEKSVENTSIVELVSVYC